MYVVSSEHAATTSASVKDDPINTFAGFAFNAVSRVPRNALSAVLASRSFAASYVTPRAAPIPTMG